MSRHLGWTLFFLMGMGCSNGPPTLQVVSAEDIGPIEEWTSLRGRDGGYSVKAFGRSVWFFGDTTLDMADERGETWLHNSWGWDDDLNASDGISLRNFADSVGAPTEPFPLTGDEAAFNESHAGEECQVEPCGARWALWPGSAVYDKDRDRVLIFYGKISAAPGDFNFESVGQGMAVWPAFDAPVERPMARPSAAEPTLHFEPSAPPFGGASLVEGDFLYAWGCRLEGLGKPCQVGRVELAQALSRSAWRFWTGSDWSEDIGAAKNLFYGNDILSVQKIDGSDTFLAIYSQPLSREVRFRTALRPEGPWSDAEFAFQAKKPDSDNGWIYDAIAHPEFSEDNGLTQYVSYSRTTGFFEGDLRLVRLTLKKR